MSTEDRIVVRDGHLVVERVANVDEAPRLRAEGELLTRLAGPGVVTVLGLIERPTGVVLRTALVGGGTLADRRGALAASEATHVGHVVATALARAHAEGVVHRRLTPDHVLLDADGEPVVCGWSGADAGDADGRAADVAALGALLLGVVRTGGPGAGDLVALARRAEAPTTEGRPSMEAMAALLAPPSAGDGHHLDAAVATSPPRATGMTAQHLALRPLAGAASLLVGLTLAVGGAMAPSVPAGETPALNESATTAPLMPPGRDHTTPATAATPVRPTPPDDGPDDEHTLEIHGGRWVVGEHGDVVVLGDWNCDGRRTPALLRPPDATVWTFDPPVGAVHEVRARAVGIVPGAERLVTRRVEEGCDVLQVVDANGGITHLQP
ncbi:MAG TPA: hypothetical protein VMN58_09805 [Acidimicrobiales bacterium]|nr:hypothetical protein [Acidimicrobiales bacterium]